MSRLSELLRQVALKDERLAADLKRETDALADRRAFGLNFERHVPEAVELPGRPVRKNDKVHVLLAREKHVRLANLRAIKESARSDVEKAEVYRLESELTNCNRVLWRVASIDRKADTATLTRSVREEGGRLETTAAAIDNLVVVAEFRDPIYPGLASTGKVERGEPDRPCHVVINAENYHALQALLFTHRGNVDAIYIDPPYNSGAKDWKYNNDYVESDDLYRHSKWLAMMERRLSLGRELLNPRGSVLIVSIDEKEYLRLGLLLEQLFPDANIQMISSVINPKGSSRAGFRRADEYLFFVMLGGVVPEKVPLSPEWLASSKKIKEWAAGIASDDDSASDAVEPGWTSMMRRGSNSLRADRPNMFYPIYVDPELRRIVEVGTAIPSGKHKAPPRGGLVAILPLRSNGDEGRWQVGPDELVARLEQGRVRLGRETSYGYVVNYLPDGAYQDVVDGKFEVQGRAEDGSLIAWSVQSDDEDDRVAPTQWKIESHNASEHGTSLLGLFVPGRKFNNPKSLYAVEDTLYFFLASKKNAIVVDFFSGSGTTAHALMRLNRRDEGTRTAISITNNEVSADEAKALRDSGFRPGDPDWERRGICEFITKPRVTAAVTGKAPEGKKIAGNYKFIDEFPMADGFAENVEFFTLTYEAPLRVSTNREFAKIAPFLWLRAGSRGRRIDDISAGWDIADAYGVIADLDQSEQFLKAIDDEPSVTHAFIVTDEDRLFEAMVRQLPAHVEPVRLYEAYLRNFEIEAGRAAR